MSKQICKKLNDDVNAGRHEYDGLQDVLLGQKDKGPAKDVRFNPETRRLELVYGPPHS